MVFNRRGSLFNDFESEFSEMNRMMDRMFEGMRDWDWTKMPINQPVYYGVSVDVGPDGIPHVQQFGNVRPGATPTLESGVREPFVTSFLDEENNQFRITAEMPGIDKKKVKVEALDDAITLSAEGDDRKYAKSIRLQAPVDPDSAKATYNNGVLEVRVNLRKPVTPKGRDVKVE